MVWHAGHALSQSVFTCRYLHLAALSELQDEEAILEHAATSGRAPYPVQLISVVLRAFCRATLKTCDVAMEELLKRHLYDVGGRGGVTWPAAAGASDLATDAMLALALPIPRSHTHPSTTRWQERRLRLGQGRGKSA
jgi:hypothetical protein